MSVAFGISHKTPKSVTWTPLCLLEGYWSCEACWIFADFGPRRRFPPNGIFPNIFFIPVCPRSTVAESALLRFRLPVKIIVLHCLCNSDPDPGLRLNSFFGCFFCSILLLFVCISIYNNKVCKSRVGMCLAFQNLCKFPVCPSFTMSGSRWALCCFHPDSFNEKNPLSNPLFVLPHDLSRTAMFDHTITCKSGFAYFPLPFPFQFDSR